jgi:hypothetical protein
MKDWSAIARAHGFDIPPTELARAASTLEMLEQAFRPLTKRLTPEMEPALLFRAEEETE